MADRAAQAALDAAATAGREAERLAAEAGEIRSQVTAYESAANGAGSPSAGTDRAPAPAQARQAGRPREPATRTTAPVSPAQPKADLLRQAAALGISGRTTMSKAQLVSAINRAPAGRG
jgi:hypothetical protein